MKTNFVVGDRVRIKTHNRDLWLGRVGTIKSVGTYDTAHPYTITWDVCPSEGDGGVWGDFYLEAVDETSDFEVDI